MATLNDPAHWDDEPFEAIVSNPAAAFRWDGDANPLDQRPALCARRRARAQSKADLVFTLHMLSWVGTPARRDRPVSLAYPTERGAEQKIRRQYQAIDNNYIDSVIQLPPDLFFGTTISTCIVVLKKSKRRQQQDALYRRVGRVPVWRQQNKLAEGNRQKILDAFTERNDIEHFARLRATTATSLRTPTTSRFHPGSSRKTLVKLVDIKVLNADIMRITGRQNCIANAN